MPQQQQQEQGVHPQVLRGQDWHGGPLQADQSDLQTGKKEQSLYNIYCLFVKDRYESFYCFATKKISSKNRNNKEVWVITNCVENLVKEQLLNSFSKSWVYQK